MTLIKQRKLIDNCMIYTAGAVVYTITEVLWRGHSHWTMTLTGGACTLLIHLANKRLCSRHFLLRCCVGSGIITAAEFVVGCMVNLILGWNVWDYSSLPLNIMGQVCLLYSIMWFFLSIPAVALSSWLEGTRRNSGEIVFG